MGCFLSVRAGIETRSCRVGSVQDLATGGAMALFTRASRGQSGLQAWYNPRLAEPVEQVQERAPAVLGLGEAGLPALGHVGVGLDGATEVAVGVPPRGELIDIRLGQALALGDAPPDLGGLGHLLDQR